MTLYKFRECCELHLSSLYNRELYFSSPAQLNDPFDSRLPVYVGASKEEIRRYLEFVGTDITEENISAMRAELKDGYMDVQSNEALLSRFGICSFSMLRDSLTMWSMYSNGHRGYCIEYDNDLLLRDVESFKNDSKLGILWGDVNYVSYLPKIQVGSVEIIKLFLSKSHQYEYEKEFRIVLAGKNNFVVTYTKEVVKSVILGLEVSEFYEHTLRNIVKEKYPGARLLKARKSKDEIGLTFN
ncbi:MAG: DUF2971 domain-containing protein [Proteobacteria bacterium]|nr:DUF2971 domain-containing protein [Pseudomonadota bacterium]